MRSCHYFPFLYTIIKLTELFGLPFYKTWEQAFDARTSVYSTAARLALGREREGEYRPRGGVGNRSDPPSLPPGFEDAGKSDKKHVRRYIVLYLTSNKKVAAYYLMRHFAVGCPSSDFVNLCICFEAI